MWYTDYPLYVPGLHDFNQEQECSILIKEDYHLLAHTVLSLFNDPAKRQSITDNGVKLVHRKYQYANQRYKNIQTLHKKKMKSIAVLLTVFNRKEKTLQCLGNLYKQLPIQGYSVDIY